MSEQREPNQETLPKNADPNRTVKDKQGEVVGIAGTDFKPSPIFDESGRLVGFNRLVNSD